VTVAASASKRRQSEGFAPIIFQMASISFVVHGIGERPGVFGWLIIRSFDGGTGCTSAESLTLTRSELTVGVYEDIAKLERHELGAHVSFRP